ncbi:M15 family metallopeptidase [Vulcaniibacterium tengchongense]|uniref:Peptidoglycan L-alanyl-D-glutamate endopeptidase CwlK n=1 Tax=Vulcaniibacterium tengchongense TaxID=1273429 RepID=A0A3N4VB60_9GAMM|nr:M15 family metallopeptidase [Vulcaniibacterium tengchongense]RPE80246.1 peptidoglycan L-alanyl-D-glutamate endopeptidase CwlK [Vulcaniibacterium tengchongense]
MLAIGVAIFFLLAGLAAWLALFPEARDACAALLGRFSRRLAAGAARLGERVSSRGADSGQRLRAGTNSLLRRLQRNRWPLLAAVAVLAVPPLLILQLRQRPQLELFDDAVVDPAQSQVLALLRGERLVPPPDLPPEIFIAAEATLLKMGPAAIVPEKIVTADRRWERIQPDFQQRVLAVYQVMREQYGIEMALVEGYRSPERQAELARAGKATRAGAGLSCHQYGLAVDSAPLRDGKLQWDMSDPWTRNAYFLYGRLAQEAGLEWGGSWRSLKDYVHLEAKSACRAAIRAARAG